MAMGDVAILGPDGAGPALGRALGRQASLASVALVEIEPPRRFREAPGHEIWGRELGASASPLSRSGRAGALANTEVEESEAGWRRAPAGLAFFAQHIAQEVLSQGLYHENFSPALAAYARAGGETAGGAPPQASPGIDLWA